MPLGFGLLRRAAITRRAFCHTAGSKECIDFTTITSSENSVVLWDSATVYRSKINLDENANAKLTKVAVKKFHSRFPRNGSVPRSSANNAFFMEQSGYMRHTPPGDVVRDIALASFLKLSEFQTLLDCIKPKVLQYFNSEGYNVMTRGSDGETTVVLVPQILCWASVHYGGSHHEPHNHLSSTADVSGVYYSQVPDDAGQLVFFNSDASTGEIIEPKEMCAVAPQEGDVILFPPWLTHSVRTTKGLEDNPRVSFAFNVHFRQMFH
mmetsp:Transcript_5606/g.9357  ORF Transcript_5606/g.9357 Transcript_5606/m.9357 type:complete len:265 (+) Transcript_5606:170-964(+)